MTFKLHAGLGRFLLRALTGSPCLLLTTTKQDAGILLSRSHPCLMTDIKLFSIHEGMATSRPGATAVLEKSLQDLMERNLEVLLGVRFLASEYSTGKVHGGRIDSLGIDENGSPVIIEYKRSTNENVINQGLFYLDWLMDHQAEFQLLVHTTLGQEEADAIEWASPRLLCIAGGFTRYDEHAVKQMNRNIELIRYISFDADLLLLELVNATTASGVSSASPSSSANSKGSKCISDVLSQLSGDLQDRYDAVREFATALGDDVQQKALKHYIAFKRLKNFLCVEVHPSLSTVTCYLKIDPDQITLEEGFTRDVRNVGHFGTGELEVKLRSRLDFERAKQLIEQSYENS